jgi:hypothetical protein
VAASPAFEAACAELERSARLEKWAARGTLQLTLMDAGLEPASVTPGQLSVVVEKLLPRQLQSHKVADAPGVCARLRDVLATVDAAAPAGADAVFARLGG